MVGVSSPLFRVAGASRFYLGLAGGMLSAALFLGALLIPISLAAKNVPIGQRVWIVAGLGVVFGCTDLISRTPQVWRQVPQRFALQGLSRGTLGAVYGADMGLLVTTQKVTSLLWLAIIGSTALTTPGVIMLTLFSAATVQAATIVVLSILDQGTVTASHFWGRSSRWWMRRAQVAAVTLLWSVPALAIQAPEWLS